MSQNLHPSRIRKHPAQSGVLRVLLASLAILGLLGGTPTQALSSFCGSAENCGKPQMAADCCSGECHCFDTAERPAPFPVAPAPEARDLAAMPLATPSACPFFVLAPDRRPLFLTRMPSGVVSDSKQCPLYQLFCSLLT
ncbi:MAG: hypothetical protein R3F31_10450 [Verrucomicrobiales bacterium]